MNGPAVFFFDTDISENTFNDGTADSNPMGACTAGSGACYSPQIELPPLTSTPQTVMVAWAALAYGMPRQTTDPTKLTGVEWSFWIAAGPTGTCTADVTIDDVKFYK